MTPPPWLLTGHGLIAAYPPGPHTPPGALMLVRYAASPVGPYEELLWLTWATGPAGVRPQVQAIWVSTRESVVWGQRNWGLPKRLARFEWTGSARRGAVRVTGEDGAEVARLAFEMSRPRLPVTSALIPAPLRTLAQPPLVPGGSWLFTRVGGAGHVTPARLTVGHADGLHPFLRHTRPLLTLAAPDFRLVFPVPTGA